MIDPTAVEIVGRIDLAPAMSDAPEFLPRASRMARFDGAVYALLLAYNVDFTDAAASRLVRIEDDVISDVVVLTDLYGCEGLAASEDALAVTCSGQLAGGDTTSPLGSGIAVLQRGSTEPVVTPAASLLGRPLGFAAAFTRTGLLVNVLGAFATDTPDVVLHVTADGFQEVLRSENPFELGDIRCTGHGGCGACFVTDGDAGALHRLAAEDGARDTTLVLDDGIGLPPRVLGRF